MFNAKIYCAVICYIIIKLSAHKGGIIQLLPLS